MRIASAPLLASAALVLAGCAAPPAAPSPATAAAVDAVPSGPPRPCTAANLDIRAGDTDAAVGNRSLSIVLANRGGAPCTLEGWPQVALLDSAGGEIGSVRTVEVEGTYLAPSAPPAEVLVAPGAEAWFAIGYAAAGAGDGPCPRASRLLVVPPGAGDALSVAVELAPCGGQVRVTPLRAGSTPR